MTVLEPPGQFQAPRTGGLDAFKPDAVAFGGGPLGGRLTNFGLPINLVRFALGKRHIKTARMVILELLEDYRRRGISELLILHTLDYGKNTIGYTGAELSWTAEDNELINRTIEAVGARRYKTYRIYQKPLGNTTGNPSPIRNPRS